MKALKKSYYKRMEDVKTRKKNAGMRQRITINKLFYVNILKIFPHKVSGNRHFARFEE